MSSSPSSTPPSPSSPESATSGSPTSRRSAIEPPPQVRTEATKGFLTGVVRFGSLSLLAHLLLSLPHPMTPHSSSSTTTSSSSSSPSPSSLPSSARRTLTRPLTSFSAFLAPASRVYRGLTPQFKVFLQIAAMTVGGCVWAERRVGEFREAVRRRRRLEERERRG